MNKKFLQDTKNKDSDEAKVFSSLKVNQDFVKKQDSLRGLIGPG